MTHLIKSIRSLNGKSLGSANFYLVLCSKNLKFNSTAAYSRKLNDIIEIKVEQHLIPLISFYF